MKSTKKKGITGPSRRQIGDGQLIKRKKLYEGTVPKTKSW